MEPGPNLRVSLTKLVVADGGLLTRHFRQWNTSFGTPQTQSNPSPQSQASAGLSVSSSGPEVQQAIDELTAVDALTTTAQQLPTQQYAASIPFITPAMWQESVASVYESGSGLKRSWDYDGLSIKR